MLEEQKVVDVDLEEVLCYAVVVVADDPLELIHGCGELVHNNNDGLAESTCQLLPTHTQRKGKKKGVKKEIKLLMHLFFLGKQANHEQCVCVCVCNTFYFYKTVSKQCVLNKEVVLHF